MDIYHRDVPFEHHADDTVCHCRTKEEAELLRDCVSKRFAECGLPLNLTKTRIVLCKDELRGEIMRISVLPFWIMNFDPVRQKPKQESFQRLSSCCEQQSGKEDE